MEYIILITRVSVTYADIFHEPKAREMTQNISCVMSMISDLSYTLCMLGAYSVEHYITTVKYCRISRATCMGK